MDKKIKELIKIVKQKDQDEDDRNEDQVNQQKIQPLKPIPGRRDMLENVTIKPNLDGKKSIGNLELHQNGIRYVSTKGLKLEIPFSQVKHAFF
jgi:nucleosome binding factor SPN SPT16 subunit